MQRTLGWVCGAAAAFALAQPALAQRSDARGLGSAVGQVQGNIKHCTEEIRGGIFGQIFECGEVQFDTAFNAADGSGGDVGNGQRFTRVPRYDLPGYLIQPVPRASGPNAQSCAECHPGVAFGGGGDGAGPASLNNVQDVVGPRGGGSPAGFVVRNPPHLFAPGSLQVLAEEMTQELQAARQGAIQQACAQGAPVSVPLRAKGIDFGSLGATPGTGDCASSAQVDTRQVRGVDPDLVVRAFGLEGKFAALRSFALAAYHNELGMEPVEFSGMNNDNDRDGVSNEILVEDVTAQTVYLAALPRPVTEVELDDLRQRLQATPEGQNLAALLALPMLSPADREQIARGERAFGEVGCAACHTPSFSLQRSVFAEPSPIASFRQPGDRSPSGLDLRANRVDPADPFLFDLVADPPNNQFLLGDQVINIGGLETDAQGRPVLRPFGDLKRHDLGPDNAEEVTRSSETGAPIPGSVFITAELWGVASTAPYLHDGSATTIEEAVRIGHGGEAAAARTAFEALPDVRRADLTRFLANLVLYFPEAVQATSILPASR